MNFTLRDLQKGKREMEKAITTVGKIRRQFSAGRPPKPGNWDTREALRTIDKRTNAITAAMQSEKLNPRDLSAVLVLGEFVEGPDQLDTSHISAIVSFLPLVRNGKSHISAAIAALLPDPAKVIVGAVYWILDHETPKPAYRCWANPAFRDVDGQAEIVLAGVLKRLEVTGKPGQDSA
jgi:hypothetical protein